MCVWHEYYLWGELKWAEQNLIVRNNSLLYFLRKVFMFPFWQFTTTLIGKDFIMKLTVEFSMVNIYSVSRLKVQTTELYRTSLACLVFCFLFFFFSLKILSPRRLCLHDLLSPLHSFCIPCWELSVKYLGWSKSTDTNASIYQLFPSWNATTHIMSMFTSWLAIALGRKILWVCSQHSHSLLLFSRCHVQVFATPWTAALLCPPLSPSLLEFMSIESVILTNHHILCRPLLLSSIFPSIRVFSNESALCIRWPQYWSFSFSHQSFEWIFRVDFL